MYSLNLDQLQHFYGEGKGEGKCCEMSTAAMIGRQFGCKKMIQSPFLRCDL